MMKKRGRPRIDIKKAFEKIKPFLQVGYSLYKACLLGKINYTTLKNYYDEDEEFRNMVERERNLVNVIARQVLIEKIKEERDGKIALEWLKRMEKEDFADRLEITGAEGKPVIDARDLLFEMFKSASKKEK